MYNGQGPYTDLLIILECINKFGYFLLNQKNKQL